MTDSNKGSRKLNPRIRSQQFEKVKRGKLKTKEKEHSSSLGPFVIGFFLFVVVGSALFQIIRTASKSF